MKLPPRHLQPPERRWYREIARDYGITDLHGETLLTTAAESLQLIREAQAVVHREGLTTLDRFGRPVQHPALRIQLAARQQLLAALRQLNLDLEPVKAIGRPPQAMGPMEI